MLGAFAPLPIRLGGSATEGLAAAQHARICADMTAVARVAPFAVLTFILVGDPALPIVTAYNCMKGVGLDPALRPLILGVTDSVFNVAWNNAEFDAYERSEPLAIRHVKASILGSAGAYVSCDWNIGESNVLVSVFDHTGAASFAADAITLRVT